jgi:hypothetical protein
MDPRETVSDADFKAYGEAMSNCMLEQTMGTVVGVAVGTALGLKTKSLKPLFVTGFIGSTADLGYGYFNACADMCQDYLVMKRARDKKGKADVNDNSK